MRRHEFHDLDALEEVKRRLATASLHPVYADLSQVVEGPTARPDDGVDRSLERIDDRYVVWNHRANSRAYFASDEYKLSQHEDVVQLIEDAMAASTSNIEFGTIRDYGEVIDGIAVLDDERAKLDVSEVVGEGYVPPEGDVDEYGDARARDRLGLGIRFKNSFDGSTRVQAETIAYRFICQNWCVWGEETIGRVEQLHLDDLDVDLFVDLISDLFEMRDDTLALIRDAETDTVPLDWTPSILNEVGFGRNYTKRICQHLDGYSAPKDVDEGYTTTWRLYNAATYELDHNTVDRAGPDVYDEHQESVQAIIEGDWSSPTETRSFDQVIA